MVLLMMNFDRTTVIQWAKFLGLAVPILGATASLMFYIDDARSSFDSIKSEQVSIRKELALQTADLESIRSVQGLIISTVERRLDKLEGELTMGLQGMAIDVGRLIERTEQ